MIVINLICLSEQTVPKAKKSSPKLTSTKQIAYKIINSSKKKIFNT